MLAISAGWVGMGFIEDINRGTMDRLLVSPIWRGALNLGSVAQSVLGIVVQSVVVIGLALVVGAHFEGGVAGVAVLVALAGLLGAVFASLSNGIAVLTRQRETLIGIVTMVTLPLTFLVGADATEPAAELDRLDRRVQPGQLGCGSRPFRGRNRGRLGADRKPDRVPRAASTRQRRVRDPAFNSYQRSM